MLKNWIKGNNRGLYGCKKQNPMEAEKAQRILLSFSKNNYPIQANKSQFFFELWDIFVSIFFYLSYWHATTKTYAYFREFGFFRIFFVRKVTLPIVKSHFKNTS